MMLKQTLEAAEYETRLNVRGPLFTGGSYQDVVHGHKSSTNIGVGLGVTDPKGGQSYLSLEYSADEPRSPRLAGFSLKTGRHPPLAIRRGKGAGGPYELWIGRDKIGNEKVANFSFPIHGLLPSIGDELPKQGRPNGKRQIARARARTVLSDIEDALSNLRVLGAFRQSPQRRYEYGGYLRDRVDIDGRHVIDALIDDTTKRGRGKGQLFDEVNSWLNAIGRVTLQSFAAVSHSARVYEVRLRSSISGRWANFADLGSGIGQAFPVIVEGLRTPIGGYYLVQEPEIHLHPDAQLGMADFLFELAASGRSVMVETHSEAILLRLRHRIAEGKPRRLDVDDIALLVVEQDSGGVSSVRRLGIDSLGQIDGWPSGFMEDVSRERLALMQAMAKTQNR
jgi:hypothetical protein